MLQEWWPPCSVVIRRAMLMLGSVQYEEYILLLQLLLFTDVHCTELYGGSLSLSSCGVIAVCLVPCTIPYYRKRVLASSFLQTS